jgi:hypothetical protein
MLQLIVSDRVFHGCDKFNSFVGDIIFVSKRMLKLVSRPEYYLKPSMCPVHLSTIFLYHGNRIFAVYVIHAHFLFSLLIRLEVEKSEVHC